MPKRLVGILASTLLACAPEHIVVQISVDGVTAQDLCVRLKLDGRPATQGDIHVQKNLSLFAVRIPNTESSRGTLDIQVRGLSEDGFITQRGSGKIELSGGAADLSTAISLNTQAPEPGFVPGTPAIPLSSPKSIWGTGPNDIYIAGDYGLLLHFDGQEYSQVDLKKANVQFRSVFGTDPNHVWAVGHYNSIFQRIGTQWAEAPRVGYTPDYLGVWGAAGNSVWAVGSAGSLRHFDGTSWSPVPSGTTLDLDAVWGTAEDDIWAVGSFPMPSDLASTPATLIHYDGSTWTPAPNKIQGTGVLRGVWGSDPQHFWAVGDRNQILNWDGTTWSVVPFVAPAPSGNRNLFSIWGTDENNVWAVGDRGLIVRWNGTSWMPQSYGYQENLAGIWGTDACNLWVVGGSGTVLRSAP